jgi:flagellar motor protein MotB
MANVKQAVITLIAGPLGSCATTQQQPQPVVPSGHNFAYAVPQRANVNLVQAFDDGTNTYLQFNQMPSAPIEIRRALDEKSMTYTLDEHYLRVPGVFDRLRVTVADNSATIINEAPVSHPQGSAANEPVADVGVPTNQSRSEPVSAVMALETLALPEGPRSPKLLMSDKPPQLRTVAVGVPESLQTMNANLRVATLKKEISALEEKVRILSKELDEAHSVGSAATLFLRDVGGAPRVVLKFEDNSPEVQVDDELLGALGNAARSANRIYLHGHTDAYVASEAGTELAILRTVEVRKLLMSLNVEPGRIRLFYRGAGNFLANNSTPEGKAVNRRVEIEMRKW